MPKQLFDSHRIGKTLIAVDAPNVGGFNILRDYNTFVYFFSEKNLKPAQNFWRAFFVGVAVNPRQGLNRKIRCRVEIFALQILRITIFHAQNRQVNPARHNIITP